MSEDKKEQKYAHKLPHYYGNHVRRLFILASIVILGALPFFSNLLPVSTLIITFVVVLLIVLAAITNPMLRLVNRLNVTASIFGLVVFENYAVNSFQDGDTQLAIVQQVLALIFFFSLYFSMKTYRAMSTGQIDREEAIANAKLPPEEDDGDFFHRLKQDDPTKYQM